MSYSQQEADLIKENSRLRTELEQSKSDHIKDIAEFSLTLAPLRIALSLAERRLEIAREGLKLICTQFGHVQVANAEDIAQHALNAMEQIK